MEREKAKILVIDDERLTLKNLMYVLQKEGYEVKGADSELRGSNIYRLRNLMWSLPIYAWKK